MIKKAIIRIKTMEMYFDTLLNAYHNHPDSILNDVVLQQYLQQLVDYYDNGQWLKDYELDEQGMIPMNIKRGVLSQDGLYNFFDDLKAFDGLNILELKELNESNNEPSTDEITQNIIDTYNDL